MISKLRGESRSPRPLFYFFTFKSVSFARNGRATALIAASVSAATALGVVASLRAATLRVSAVRTLVVLDISAVARGHALQHGAVLDPGMDARGPEVLQACQERHDDQDGQDA